MENKHDIDENTVFYCRECMSLAIINTGEQDYCKSCGSTDVSWAPFNRWRNLYRLKYGKDLLDISCRKANIQ